MLRIRLFTRALVGLAGANTYKYVYHTYVHVMHFVLFPDFPDLSAIVVGIFQKNLLDIIFVCRNTVWSELMGSRD